jgi:hypothetical protein
METTPQKSKRLSEEKKKPAEEKKPQYSAKFVPRVGGTGVKFLDEYEASGSSEQTIWWAHNTASKLDKIEAHVKEAAGMLYCKPANLVQALK